MAFHLGRDREARILLEKCAIQMQMLAVCETDLLDIASMGYSIAEARLGLRAAQGDRKLAVEHIMKKREEKQEIRKKEEEEREGEAKGQIGQVSEWDLGNLASLSLACYLLSGVLMATGLILVTTRLFWVWATLRLSRLS